MLILVDAFTGRSTHNFDSVAWSGSDVPGTLLPAWVLIRPVGATYSAGGAVDLVLTLRYRIRERE